MAIKTRYSLRKLNFENLYMFYTGRSPRDRLVLGVVAGLAALLILIMPLSMLSGKVGSLKKSITQTQKKLGEVLEKVQEYEVKRTELDSLQKKIGTGGGSITATIDSLVEQSDLKNNIDAFQENPVRRGELFIESPISVELKNVTLEQLTDFLYSVESYPGRLMRVRSLQIKPRYAARNYLDVKMEIAGISLTGEEGEG